MRADLSPEAVAPRLAELGRLYVPETLEQARERAIPRHVSEPFEAAVARRLTELRALDELTRHLRRKRPCLAR
jgi:hypothetical protein